MQINYQTMLADYKFKNKEMTKGLVINEKHVACLTLRLQEQDKEVIKALKKFDLSLPQAAKSVNNVDKTLLWISPDEYLLLLPITQKQDFITKINQALSAQHFACIDNSGGFVCLELSGDSLYDLLSTMCPYSIIKKLNNDVISSVYAGVQIIYFNHSNSAINIVVRTSFAQYFIELLQKNLRLIKSI